MWMIADSESFDNVVDIGLCHTGPKYDHCVKVIAKNLQPNTGYYFKFICGQFCSPIGRTFTKSVPSNFPQMDWPEKGFEFDRLDEYLILKILNQIRTYKTFMPNSHGRMKQSFRLLIKIPRRIGLSAIR